MKNVRSVQVIPKQRGVPQLQENKAREAKRGQSNPTQPLLIPACSKTTQSHSLQLSFLSRLPVGQWVSCQTKGIMQVIEHHSRYETQLIPPLRGASENKLMARVKDDKCTFSIGRLWPGCSQQVMNPSPLCQTQDALLVLHGLEPRVFLSILMAFLPNTAWRIDTTRHNPSLIQIKWLICFCTTFIDFYLFFPMANKYTKTKEDCPDSLRLCLFNHRII